MTPQITELVERLDGNEDARALVKAILDFHHDGIARILTAVDKDELARLTRDPLARSILDLHGLAPPEPDPTLVPATKLLAKRESARKPREDAEDDVPCELCAVPTGPRHAHVVDLEHDAIRCACTACAMLMERPGTKMKRIPTRVLRVESLAGADAAWDRLGIPVAIAFFVKRTGKDVRAYYPGAVGVVESFIEPSAFAALESAHPAVASLEPDVEAFVVGRAHGQREHWIVGLDRAYALAGRVREKWRGFSGGEDVRRELGDFWTTLASEVSHA